MVPLNLLKQNILIWLLLTRLHSLWKLAAGYLYCGLQGTSTFLATLRLRAHMSGKRQSWEKHEWKAQQRKNVLLSLPQSLLLFTINLHNFFFLLVHGHEEIQMTAHGLGYMGMPVKEP